MGQNWGSPTSPLTAAECLGQCLCGLRFWKLISDLVLEESGSANPGLLVYLAVQNH